MKLNVLSIGGKNLSVSAKFIFSSVSLFFRKGIKKGLKV